MLNDVAVFFNPVSNIFSSLTTNGVNSCSLSVQVSLKTEREKKKEMYFPIRKYAIKVQDRIYFGRAFCVLNQNILVKLLSMQILFSFVSFGAYDIRHMTDMELHLFQVSSLFLFYVEHPVIFDLKGFKAYSHLIG